MEPSSTVSFSSSGDLSNDESISTSETKTARSSFLKDVPEELSLSYRPIPMWQNVILGLGSTAVATVASTAQKEGSTTFWTVGKVMKLLLRTLLTALASTAVVQDLFYAPSRVTTSLLSDKGWLPSTLSRIAIVRPQPVGPEAEGLSATATLAVHYLLYETKSSMSSTTGPHNYFDCIHFNHGFGASSLSWLPVLPSLVDRLNSKVGIAHDAVGFGFTDRPTTESLQLYSFDTSAGIGLSLVQDVAARCTGNLTHQSVALFGHSMGALATLRMALHVPPSVNVSVILVSPALVIGRQSTRDNNNLDTVAITNSAKVKLFSSLVSRTLEKLRRVFLFTPFKYLLRRIVSYKNAWRLGLKAAWGKSSVVTEDDVLRYRWPSVSRGWEEGLIKFSSARTRTSSQKEIQLLSDVIHRPNTKVYIIHGTMDPIIPYNFSEDIIRVFPQVQLEPMDGLGHNCFEEKPDKFTTLVATKLLLNSSL